jgi:hypothetical protein
MAQRAIAASHFTSAAPNKDTTSAIGKKSFKIRLLQS